MSCFRAALSLVPALGLFVANAAHAGPVERMADVALHPSKADIIVVRYLNGGEGLLYSSDGGRSFKLLCSAAISNDEPTGPIAVTEDGHTVLGTFDGLWQDSGNGCGWSLVESLKGRWITDLTADASKPGRVFAVTGMGGPGVRNGVVSREGSNPWANLGTQDERVITRVRSVKTASGVRIYQSALVVEQPTSMDAGVSNPKYLVRVSDDEGATWREHQVAVSEGSFRLEGVDPSNPDRIIGSVGRTSMAAELIVSSDQGQSFKPYFKVSDVGGLTFAPDGRIWVGEPTSVSAPGGSRGLWYAKNLDTMPEKVGDYGIECLGYQPATESLFACQAYSFGKIDLNSWQYTESFHFKAAKEFVACDGMKMAEVCEAQLCADYCAAGHFAQALLCCAYNTSACGPLIAESEGTGGPEMCGATAADGGMMPVAGSAGTAAGSSAAGSQAAGSGGGAAAAPPPGKNDGGCSCRAAGGDAQATQHLQLLSLVLALALLRCRRRLRPPQSRQRLRLRPLLAVVYGRLR